MGRLMENQYNIHDDKNGTIVGESFSGDSNVPEKFYRNVSVSMTKIIIKKSDL